MCLFLPMEKKMTIEQFFYGFYNKYHDLMNEFLKLKKNKKCL